MLSEAQKELALKAYEGAKPRFKPGRYGKRYDSYTCRHCGSTLKDIVDNFCFNCGFRILWDNPRCLTGKDGDKNDEYAM